MLVTVLATLTVISVLVFVHELGHYIAARALGVAAPRFSIGLGPRIIGFRWKGTEWVLSAILLGGYVRIAGMEDDSDALEGEALDAEIPSEQLYSTKPRWARAIILSAGVFMNLLFALLIFTGLAITRGVPSPLPTEVMSVDASALPAGMAALAELERPFRIVQIGSRPVETWDELRESLTLATPGMVSIRINGDQTVQVDIPRGSDARSRIVAGLTPLLPPRIGEVVPGSPAAHAGLKKGDSITAIGEVQVSDWPTLAREIALNPARTIAIKLIRDGQERTISVTLEARTQPQEAGAKGWLGASPEVANTSVGVSGALRHGIHTTSYLTRLTGQSFREMVTGSISPRSLGGPIMIGAASGESVRRGPEFFFSFMAFVSISLAVFNLLPIPILDGGHLMLLAIEGILRRPLSRPIRRLALNTGLLLVLALMSWALLNDLLRLFGV